ncbi:MAG: hypothetical protein LUH14_07085 [Clostridiaceae bacterium]|nr:hypothetical protein [Clostridiaceae bacterium]
MILNSVLLNSQMVFANQSTDGIKYNFDDGITYSVRIDVSNNIFVKAAEQGYETEMVLDENLNCTIDLNDDEGTVEEYVDCGEVFVDQYSGQVAVAVTAGTIIIGSLVTALLYACLVITKFYAKNRIKVGADTMSMGNLKNIEFIFD